jgi:hypothetical protein
MGNIGISFFPSGFLFLFTAVSSTSGATVSREVPALVELTSQQELDLPEVIHRASWNKILLREIRATADGVWALIDSKQQPNQSALVKVGFDGRLQRFIDLPGTPPNGAFVLSSRGPVVVIGIQGRGFLRQYDESGRSDVAADIAVPCFSQLIAIAGQPATICQDGTVTVYGSGASPMRYSSWARPGTLVEAVAGKNLAIVDQVSGQRLLYDLETGRTTATGGTAPEIEEALRKTSEHDRRAMQQAASERGPAAGRSLVAMDSAVDESGWYLLIWPIPPNLGPGVVKFDSSGQLLARYRCRTPSGTAAWHRIDAANGYLIVASSAGKILRYRP